MKHCFLLVLLIGVFVSACKETDTRPKCQSVEHAPQEFLDYWFFPKGSWWVYKLKGSEPAVYDTVRNGNRHMAIYTEPYEDAGIGKNCQMFYIHDLRHSNSQYFANTEPNKPGGEALRGYTLGNKWIVQQSWDSFGHAAEGYIFFYPFSIGEVFSQSDNWVADTNIVVTPGYTFQNSVGMFSGHGGNPDTASYPQRRIHFTKGIGITKRRYYNGQVWELVNYHINK